jgi:hypothetical protein
MIARFLSSKLAGVMVPALSPGAQPQAGLRARP